MLIDIGRYSWFWRALALPLIGVVGILSTIASSSGGSGGVPPIATITFPENGFETPDTKITVTGNASDETGVNSVTVNGVRASTNDGFATWQANVPLVEGLNTLTVATLDTLGFSDPMAAEVEVISSSAPPLATVSFPPLNSFSNSGAVTVTGTAIDAKSNVVSVSVNGVDATSNDAFATWRVVRVPLTAGEANILTVRTLDSRGFEDQRAAEVVVNVAPDVTGNAVTFGDAYALALSEQLAYVLDFDNDEIVEVNLDTGGTSIVSDAVTGGGAQLAGPDGIALINNGAFALVSNFVTDEILSVNLADGSRSRLSSASSGIGAGPTLFGPSGIEIIDSTLAVVSNFAADDVMTVNLVNGDRAVLSGEGTLGAGPGFFQPDGIALDRVNDRIVVTDALRDAVFTVDLATGDRTIISDNTSTGVGPVFVNPVGIVIDGSGNSAIVADRDAHRLVAVDLVTGNREILSESVSNTGVGPTFEFPTGVAYDALNNRLVVSGQNLVVVEPGSGDRVIVGQ